MILLDTHALVWWQENNPRLSASARLVIADEQRAGEIAVSAFSCWEIAMLVARSRLQQSCSPSTWLAGIAAKDGIRFIPIDQDIAVAAVQLPGSMHKDPADRFIVATARWLGVPIVTADRQIQAYAHVMTIW
jgi:PIN domain nuclease of toxin-antitoxin system